MGIVNDAEIGLQGGAGFSSAGMSGVPNGVGMALSCFGFAFYQELKEMGAQLFAAKRYRRAEEIWTRGAQLFNVLEVRPRLRCANSLPKTLLPMFGDVHCLVTTTGK